MANDVVLPGFEALAGAEVVQKLPLFRTLTFDETRRLFELARPEEHAAGSVIIEEESLGRGLIIVVSGKVEVQRQGASLGVLGAGELLGEMSLVDDVLTSSRVVALETTKVLAIARQDFDALLAAEPALAVKVYKAFCRTLADRLRRANELLPRDKILSHGGR